MAPLSEPRFREVTKFSSEYAAAATISQFSSSRTGMRVVIVDRPGPMISGYFTLATEIHNDSGAPHTLEHLCFMGSKSYHFPSMLGRLSSRAYSNINAWTDVDHTCYQLDSAGWDGFAQILPVYLEHLLLPTLSDASCYTEVWHINQDACDAGVVYAEMQGGQNNQEEIMNLEMKRLLYPEGDGLRSETGGLMEELRILTPSQIRDFHKAMYRFENLCLILDGMVDQSDLFRILGDFEDLVLRESPETGPEFPRPWTESKQTSRIAASHVKLVEFPDEDESVGAVTVTFNGPAIVDHVLVVATNIMVRYLARNSASILEYTLVEKEQLAYGVYFDVKHVHHVRTTFTLSGVVTEKLAEVEQRLLDVLKDAAHKELDMDYMLNCVELYKREAKIMSETSKEAFAAPVIQNFMYSSRSEDSLEDSLNDFKDFDVLKGWTEQQWRQFLVEWFSDANHVTILGRPSASLAAKTKGNDDARVKARKNDLGEEGLRMLAEKLEDAKKGNGEVPAELLKKFEVPSSATIKFIETTTARSGSARNFKPLHNSLQNSIDGQHLDLPLFLQFEQIPSAFVTVCILVSTDKIPTELRPMLPIYMETFFSSPMWLDDRRVEFQDVIKSLEQDVVRYSFEMGGGLGNSETLVIKFQVEQSKYHVAIRWLQSFMSTNSIIDLERISTTTVRLLGEIPDEKRDGEYMMTAIYRMMTMATSSINRACCTLTQATFLKHVKRKLRRDPEEILTQVQRIKEALWQTGNFRILVAGDIERLEDPVRAWSAFSEKIPESQLIDPLENRLSRLSALGRNPNRTAYIVPIPAIDSSFAIVSTKGPSSYLNPSIPALMVAIAHLNDLEGPIWTAVRGDGLAYGAWIQHDQQGGLIKLELSNSPDAFKAYIACRQVVEDFASRKTPITDLALESAISSLVLEIAMMEDNAVDAAELSFVRQVVRGQEKDWNQKLLRKAEAVTVDEVYAVIKDMLLPIFDYEKSILVITCAPSMQDGLVKNISELGLQPEVKSLADFQDSSGFEADDGEDEDEDENEDEDDEDEEENDDGVDDNDDAEEGGEEEP